jgi:hypothetical protein
MWFLQLIEEYRKDITVVNLSLLNVPWYINQLKNNYPTGTNNIKINLSDKEIEKLSPKLWEDKIGLYEYLSLEGLVYKLETHKQDMNLGQLEKNSMEKYKYETIGDDHIRNVQEMRWIFQNYRSGYARLVSHFLNEGNIDKAKAVLETMNNKIPEEKVPYTSEEFKNEVENLSAKINK